MSEFNSSNGSDGGQVNQASSRNSEAGGGFMTFDKMIGPSLLKVVYVLGCLVIIISCLINMFSRHGQGFFMGLLSIVLGMLVWRIWCEIAIVFYKIHETNTSMLKELRRINNN